MKRMLSVLVLLGTFLLLPLGAQGQEYTITFEQVEHCTITASHGYGASKTKVKSGDKVSKYTYLSIVATPDEGYIVTHYIINGAERENSTGSVSEMVKEDLTISARVVEVRPCTVTITQPEHGTLKVSRGANEVKSGTQINSGNMLKLELTPEAGYEIEYWLINGKKLLPNEAGGNRNILYHKLVDNVTLSAQLKVEGTKTLVPVTIVNPEHATIKAYKGNSTYNTPELPSGEKVEAGSDVTVKITPDDLYALDYWLINSERVEKESGFFANDKVITIVDATTISAVLKESGYKVTYAQPEHGKLTVSTGYPPTTVASGSRVKERAILTIQATVEVGYVFKHFLVNGEIKTSSSPRSPFITYTAESDVIIEAVIEKVPACIVTIEPFEHGTLTVSYGNYASPTVVNSGDEVPAGTSLTIKAEVDPAYEFKHFLVNGVETPSSSTYSYTIYSYKVTGPVTFAVVAEKKPGAVVTIEPFEHGKLDVSYGPYSNVTQVASGDEVPIGAKLDVYVDFDKGYGLDHFLVNGESKTSEYGYYIGVTVEGPTTLSAVAKRTHGQVVMVQPDATQGKMTAYFFDNGEQKDLRDSTWVALDKVVTFSVAPTEGYEMDYWMINDARQELEAGTPNNKVITIEGDLKVQPILKEKVAPAPVEKVQLSVQEEGVGGFVSVSYQTPGSTTWAKPSESKNPTLDLPIGTKVKVVATIAISGSTVSFTHNDTPVATDKLSNDGLTYEFTLEEAATIKAIFKEGIIGFPIFYACDEHATIAGTADGKSFTNGEKIAAGALVELTVTPEEGYEVKRWVDADFALIPGTEGKTIYSFTVEGTASLFAEIQEKVAPAGCKLTLVPISTEQGRFYASDDDLNSIPNGASVPVGSTVYLTVELSSDYELDHWMINDKRQAEFDGRTEIEVTVTAEMTELKVEPILKKKEAPLPTEGKITMVQPEATQGVMTAYYFSEGLQVDVTDGATVAMGVSVTFHVSPAEGYEMDYWMINEARQELEAGTPNNKVIDIEGDLKVQPILKEKGTQPATEATVTLQSEGTGGFIMGKFKEPDAENERSLFSNMPQKMKVGSTVRITATITPGFEVTYTNNGQPVPAEALSEEGKVYSFTVEGDATVKATFAQKQTTGEYTVTYTAGEGGTVTATADMEAFESGTKVSGGKTIKVMAQANEDYEVDQWKLNGKVLEANAGRDSYMFVLAEETTVEVTFRSTKPIEYAVTLQPIKPSAEAGTIQLFKQDGTVVTSGTAVADGAEMYVEVKAADKYELESLKVNNTTIKAGDKTLVKLAEGGYKYSFTVTEATSIEVTFKLIKGIEDIAQREIIAQVTRGGTRLEIVGAPDGAEVCLYDYTGQLLRISTEASLDISALPAGSYIVLVGDYATRIMK